MPKALIVLPKLELGVALLAHFVGQNVFVSVSNGGVRHSNQKWPGFRARLFAKVPSPIAIFERFHAQILAFTRLFPVIWVLIS